MKGINLLAENLLRFGTKNLSNSDKQLLEEIKKKNRLAEQTIKSTLIAKYKSAQNIGNQLNQAALGNTMKGLYTTPDGKSISPDEFKKLPGVDKNDSTGVSSKGFNKLAAKVLDGYNAWMGVYDRYKIVLPGGRDQWALAFALACRPKRVDHYENERKAKKGGDILKSRIYVQSPNVRFQNPKVSDPQQFNALDKTTIQSVGTFTATSYDKNDSSNKSDFLETLKYINMRNLQQMIDTEARETDAGHVALNTKSKTGGAYLVKKSFAGFVFYGSTTYNPGKAKTKGSIATVVVDKRPGIDIQMDFSRGFAKMETNIQPGVIETELKKITATGLKVLSIRIESSASGDEPTPDGSGYPKGHTPGTPYQPKSPNESGNAKLAFGRAAAIKGPLQQALNVTPTVTAVIKDGKEAARYVRAYVTLQDPGNPGKRISKQDLQKLIAEPASTTGVGGIFQAVPVTFSAQRKK